MLSNAYFLAKFRFDTAENEPAKKLQNFINFPNFANPNPNFADPKVTAEIAAIIARGETPPTPMTHQYLNETVKSRIMFLDGGMGAPERYL